MRALPATTAAACSSLTTTAASPVATSRVTTAGPPRSSALTTPRWCGAPTPTSSAATGWLSPASRRVYQLDHLGLPSTPRSDDPQKGLAFDLLSRAQQHVITGHADGVITIDLAEGDDPHREALRVELAEPYRTMLGHLRHETGHWYWDVRQRLARPGPLPRPGR